MTFDQHLEENTEMWDMFVKYAIEIGAQGKKFSAAGIFHLMRYETMVREENSDFKISQNWCPLYARKFLDEYPEYPIFRLKELRS